MERKFQLQSHFVRRRHAIDSQFNAILDIRIIQVARSLKSLQAFVDEMFFLVALFKIMGSSTMSIPSMVWPSCRRNSQFPQVNRLEPPWRSITVRAIGEQIPFVSWFPSLKYVSSTCKSPVCYPNEVLLVIADLPVRLWFQSIHEECVSAVYHRRERVCLSMRKQERRNGRRGVVEFVVLLICIQKRNQKRLEISTIFACSVLQIFQVKVITDVGRSLSSLAD